MEQRDSPDADHAVRIRVTDFERSKVVQRLVHGVTLTTQKETRRAAPGTVSTICHSYASTLRRRLGGGVPTRHFIYRNHAFSARSSISIGNVILNTPPGFYAD